MSDEQKQQTSPRAREATTSATQTKPDAPGLVPIIFIRDTGNNVVGDISGKPEQVVRNEEAKGERATFRRLNEAELSARNLKK